MMNIIFLDVDGVLNSIESARTFVEQRCRIKKNLSEKEKTNVAIVQLQSGAFDDWPFSEKSLECLVKIVEKADAKIVVSSCWRLCEKEKQRLLAKMSEYNLAGKVIGYTPYLPRFGREKEIQTFLEQLNQRANYIILDDDIEFFQNTSAYLVRTSAEYGLQENHIEKALEIFRKQENNEL